jgi:hypothetical protein
MESSISQAASRSGARTGTTRGTTRRARPTIQPDPKPEPGGRRAAAAGCPRHHRLALHLGRESSRHGTVPCRGSGVSKPIQGRTVPRRQCHGMIFRFRGGWRCVSRPSRTSRADPSSPARSYRPRVQAPPCPFPPGAQSEKPGLHKSSLRERRGSTVSGAQPLTVEPGPLRASLQTLPEGRLF